MNWNASLSLKIQKDKFYLNQEVPRPSHTFRPIGTTEVPTGPPGC